ncbi:DUF6009 family protein [Kitasatospora sp. NPDC085895]|uniref:DUF6009 family protein n=1 Tax=Kitasatospora sp. NPDC085895 TaxID=3155057 RepID=UPI003450C5FF
MAPPPQPRPAARQPLRRRAPGEAVDQRTVAPTVKGDKTERSQGGPASPAMVELAITLPKS